MFSAHSSMLHLFWGCGVIGQLPEASCCCCTGKRKGAEQGPIELLPSPTAPAKKKPNVAARIESLAFQADMVDYGTKGCHPPSELMRIAQKAWSLAEKQDQHKAASLPPGQSEKIGRLLQELEEKLDAARLLISQ